MIDFRRLQVLRTVAHYGTVTAAAQALHVTTSAASHQIRELGRELGVTLLEPQGRGVRLTPSARELLEHADAIEERWARAYAALHSRDEPAGTVRLCATPTALSALVAPAAKALARRHPKLLPKVTEAEPAEGFDRLLSNDADVTVFTVTSDTPPRTDARFEQEPLLQDPFDLLVANDHPFAAAEHLALADAGREPWIVEMAPISSRYDTLGACTSAGFRPHIAHEARQWSVVATLVAHQLGVALVPRLAQLPTQLGVTHVPLHGHPTPSRLLLSATRRGSRDHPTIAAATAELVRMAQRLSEDVPATQ